ncbi:MAG: TA system VapC family ribonuclease toxin [Terracidiphilus sp.]|jgi:toxin-antitoxin system PIN domain toxin
MSSLSFPDINVWLAIATPEHVHASLARDWWKKETGAIAFCRLTQLGFLRLMTTAAVMDGKPLTMSEAWRVYDRLYDDDRVTFVAEPPEVDKRFREKATGRTASPKVWADAWLLAVAQAAEGVLVTFDKALASRGALCLLPKEEKPSRR